MKDALALALVHFIWQGAVLALAGALLMRVTKVPSVRYAVGVATLFAMLLAPVITWLAIENGAVLQVASRQTATPGSDAAAAGHRTLPSTTGSVAANTSAERGSARVVVPATLILSLWAVGVLLLSLRFLGGWAVARRLATQTLTPVGEELQSLAAHLAKRLNVHGAVRVCESASVAVPMMIGWLRPVIVLPPAALAALPLSQLEALLAHELAHIRRHDYLVNLLQTGVETLCFYHPAVWWISREVRCHREHCCDDVAVGVCDRLTYVTALSSLASMSTPQLALSAAGGSLRDRVRRLIEPTTHSASPKGAWIAMLPILLVVSFVAPHAWGAQSTTPVAATVKAATAVEVPVEVAVAIAPDQARPVTAAREAARARRLEAERTAQEVRAESEVRVGREVQAEVERAVRAQTERAREVRREVERAVEAAQAREAVRATEGSRVSQEVQRNLERRRLELLHQVKSAEAATEQAATEARLHQEELSLARHRELVEKGLATRNGLVHAEEQVAATRRHLETARANRDLNEAEFELRRYAAVELDRMSTTHRNVSPLDASAQLQPQDRLEITIDGEPDLPTMFTVREDGSIRFPFLGSIRVQGSTTAQVQSAIRKLISDKSLTRNPVVTVSAGRLR